MRKALTSASGVALLLAVSGCSFTQDRVLDFVDITGLKVVAGKGLKVGAELGPSTFGTEYDDFFLLGLRRHLLPPAPILGYYDFEKYGWQGRAAGVWRDKGFDLIAPIDRKLRVVAGNDYLFEQVDEFNYNYRRSPETANRVPLEYRQNRYHYMSDIHVYAAFWLGFEIYVSPWQAMDFVLGFFHIDIAKDDEWNRTYDEFEDRQPPPEEFKRPQIQNETTGV